MRINRFFLAGGMLLSLPVFADELPAFPAPFDKLLSSWTHAHCETLLKGKSAITSDGNATRASCIVGKQEAVIFAQLSNDNKTLRVVGDEPIENVLADASDVNETDISTNQPAAVTKFIYSMQGEPIKNHIYKLHEKFNFDACYFAGYTSSFTYTTKVSDGSLSGSCSRDNGEIFTSKLAIEKGRVKTEFVVDLAALDLAQGRIKIGLAK